MIYHNFLLFKMNISSKIELREKIECAENLVLYSSRCQCDITGLPPEADKKLRRTVFRIDHSVTIRTDVVISNCFLARCSP